MSANPSPHPNHFWETLVATAVLGTERRAFTQPQAEGALGAAFARIDQSQSERALLGAAALLSAYRRAGMLPPEVEPPTPSFAPADNLPICSARAAQHLETMLSGTHRALLPEWLSTLAARGKRVPPRVLPALLDAGRTQSDWHPLIRDALGECGRWLAAQNPEWDYAAVHTSPKLTLDPAALDETWQTGSRATRRALLATLRPVAPDSARGLIESTWGSERADDRAALLESLSIGLSMADEPFLEAALDDRSKEVRANAVELLARLPQSRLIQRMITRLEPLIRWIPPEGSRLLGLVQGRPGRIDVTPPETCDKAMARDGVDPKAARNAQGLGERAQWLHQMVRVIPPSYWSTGWNVAPAELIAATQRSDWSTAILPAWVAATWRMGDATWAEAFLRLDPSQDELLDVLPVERQETLLLELLATLDRPLGEHPVLTLLRRTRHTWSPALARMTLAATRKQMSAWAASRDYALYSALPEFALRLPPALLPEAADGWRNHNGHEQWQTAIDRMLVTFQFRSDMLQSLHE